MTVLVKIVSICNVDNRVRYSTWKDLQ